MAATSNHVQPGSPAPEFDLPDAGGRRHRLLDERGKAGTLVAFICNHCPYVLHMRDALAAYAVELAPRGVRVLAINPNDPVAYPEETAQKIAEVARRFTFPYLIDEEQKVAAVYDAVCTPDLYLYDGGLKLYYHGQFDETRPGGPAASGRDLRRATELLLAGKPAPAPQAPSIGCSIKWKPGRAPAGH